MRIGFIGLGRMGRPMTENLLKAGHEVTVHNRSRAVVDELAARGARPATSPRQVSEASEIVFTSLPTPEAVDEVYLGPDGLVPAARPGQLLIDTSTVSPVQSRKLAAAVAERGARFLDAPVSGGPAGAQSGTLTFMIGGEAEAFERALPVLRVLGKNIHHVGPSGAGSVVKLVNQLLVGIHTVAAAEAMVFGVKAGADPKAILDVIGSSFGASAMLNRHVPRMLKRDFDPATSVNLILKDLGLIHDYGKDLGVPMLVGGLAEQLFLHARSSGLGDSDMAALVVPLERLTGVEVVSKG